MRFLKTLPVLISLALVTAGAYYIIKRTDNMQMAAATSEPMPDDNLPSILSEFKNFERVFHGQKDLSWHISANRALVYEQNLVEFEKFRIELIKGENTIKITGDWGLVEINDSKVKSLRADGSITVNFINRGLIFNARECILSDGFNLNCSAAIIESERWITSAQYADFNLNDNDLNLRGRVKTVALQ